MKVNTTATTKKSGRENVISCKTRVLMSHNSDANLRHSAAAVGVQQPGRLLIGTSIQLAASTTVPAFKSTSRLLGCNTVIAVIL